LGSDAEIDAGTDPRFGGSARQRPLYVLTGLAPTGIAGADSCAFSSGLATRARASIEEAMAAVYQRLNLGKEIDWAKYDARFESRSRILPLKAATRLERGMDRLSRCLGEQFRL
jgi:hypothetical protein